MNTTPPGPDPSDQADSLYRQASAQDRSRPSDAVRQAVLAHAAKLAAAGARGPERSGSYSLWRLLSQPAWRPALLGTLASAVLAALMLPWLLAPDVTPVAGPPVAPMRPARSAPAPAPQTESALSPTPEPHTKAALSPTREPHTESALSPAPPTVAAGTATTAPLRAPDSHTSARQLAAARAPEPGRAAPDEAAASDAANLGAALRGAAEAGDVAALERLLAEEPDVEARDSAGRTALMLATVHGHAEVVATLLQHGADPNAADSSGTTPLQAARAGERSAIIGMLQRYGAER